jgi:hypothetical protein
LICFAAVAWQGFPAGGEDSQYFCVAQTSECKLSWLISHRSVGVHVCSLKLVLLLLPGKADLLVEKQPVLQRCSNK